MNKKIFLLELKENKMRTLFNLFASVLLLASVSWAQVSPQHATVEEGATPYPTQHLRALGAIRTDTPAPRAADTKWVGLIADALNRLWVNAAISNPITDPVQIANVGQAGICSTALTVAAGEHIAGDVIGGKITCTGMGRSNVGSGRITGVVVFDEGQEGANLALYPYNADSTIAADDAPHDPSDADLRNMSAPIHITQHEALANNGFSSTAEIARPYDFGAGTSGTFALVAVEAITPDATDAIDIDIYYEMD